MYADLKCTQCGTEIEAVIPNDIRIGDEIELEELRCSKCGMVRFVRILQSSISKHSSWSNWNKPQGEE